MKNALLITGTLALLVACGGKDEKAKNSENAGSSVQLKSHQDSVSYAVGYDIGLSLSQNPEMSSQMNLESLIAGIEKGHSGNAEMPSQEEMFGLQMQAQQEQQAGGLSEDLIKKMSEIQGIKFGEMLGDLNQYDPENAIDMALFKTGVEKGQVQDSTILNKEEMMKINTQFSFTMQKAQQKKMEEESKETIAAGEAFLAEKEKEEGIMKTESGLLYKVIKKGNGPKPTESDKVEVHYEGTLIDGTVFDSSYERGETTEFGITQVISGWTEGLQLMSKGATYMFYIPQELGYGMNPRPGGVIKPGDALVFKVELVDIK